MSYETRLEEFRDLIRRIEYLKYTLNSLIYWDKITYMPPDGIEYRSQVMSFLADEQYKLGKNIKSQKELVPGDLVFFSTYEKGAYHCGIYLGENKFIHVSSSKGVRVDELSDKYYWKAHWYGGKHIVK